MLPWLRPGLRKGSFVFTGAHVLQPDA